MTPLRYLKENLNQEQSFVREFMKLSHEDKEDLQRAAKEEMRLLGVE